MIVVLFLIACVVCFYYLRCKYTYVKKIAVFPNSVPIGGHCLLLKRDLFAFIKGIGEHAVKNNGLSSFLFTFIPIYVIADPVQATVILNTCLKKSFVYKLINPLFGDTLVSASVPTWKRNRRILDVAFKPNVLEGYMGVFNTQASRLLELIETTAEGKGYVDLTEEITQNVLETTCQTTMGMLSNGQNYVNDKYVKSLHKVFEVTTLRVQKPWIFFDSIFYFSKERRVLEENLKVIHGISEKMVQLRKSEYVERTKINDDFKDGNFLSFLDILIQNSMTAEGSIFTDLQLRYLCDNILLAAFDTTTYELLFTLVCIGSDQEIQQKIFLEIKAVLGDEEIVKKEHLFKLVYLEAAIKEALRLYPIAPVVGRESSTEVKLDNVTIPSGSWVAVHLWSINRHQKYWGPDAGEFNPDRWLDVKTMPEHPNAFGSFSFGRRNCIGKSYAMMHMKTTLVHILRKYWIFSNHKDMEFDCYIMLKVKSGHLMKLKLR